MAISVQVLVGAITMIIINYGPKFMLFLERLSRDKTDEV